MSVNETGEIFAEAFAFDLPDEAASERFAEDVAIVLRTGDIVALSGDLGAGKTTLARAILRHLAADDTLEVPSPTYTLVQTYETRPKATHYDLYRIAAEDELLELGFEEAAETGIVLVEWPERSGLVAAETNLSLNLDTVSTGGRRLVARAAAETASRLSRSLAARALLREAGLGNARRRLMMADASARRYEHVAGSDRRLVLMDAPALPRGPVLRDGRTYAEIARIAQDVRPFVALAGYLGERGFCVPAVHAAALDAGLLLLADLGDDRIVADERPIPDRYAEAARALALVHREPVPAAIPVPGQAEPYSVPPFDRAAMEIEISLLPDWFLPRMTGHATPAAERERFEAAWTPLLHRIAAGEQRLVLRDYHSPNILWQSESTDHRRIGMLDFQDAMIGPGAYDLASLAQDARVDVPAEEEDAIRAAYMAVRASEPGFDPAAFEESYAIMSAQRATKIMGLFVRLSERDGKPQYLRHIPRIQGYLKRTLTHPSLTALRALYGEWGVLDAPPSAGPSGTRR